MHASDSGYLNSRTCGSPATSSCRSSRPPSGALRWATGRSWTRWGALVCHGALSRNPDLRILSIENGADWVPDLFKGLKGVYKKMPQAFLEDPGRGVQAGACTSPRSGRTGSPRSSTWSAPDWVLFDLTGRTLKASRTRSLRRRAKDFGESDVAKIMGGNLDEPMQGVRTGQEAGFRLIEDAASPWPIAGRAFTGTAAARSAAGRRICTDDPWLCRFRGGPSRHPRPVDGRGPEIVRWPLTGSPRCR